MFKRSVARCRRTISTNAAETGTQFLTERIWDAVIVGGGHNGLTCAAYLTKAGLQVAVLEKRPVLGGAAVTEEIVSGFKFSRASYLQSLLRPSIIRDLDLHRHGLKLLPRNPSSFTPTSDGRYLLMGPDAALNHAEIQKFSKRDAASYPLYEEKLQRFCNFLDPLMDAVPPETAGYRSSVIGRLHDGFSQVSFWSKVLKRSAVLGRREMVDLIEFLVAPASKVLDYWFEADILKATLATDAAIGSMASIHTPGSGYVLLHHVMGETNGVRGIWSYVEGGMGAVSTAIGKAAVEAGATLVTNAEVKQVTMRDGHSGQVVTGVLLADGTEVKAKAVLSNATPAVTFQKLIPECSLPEEFLRKIRMTDYRSGTTKFNVAVDKLPCFSACRKKCKEPGPEHFGTIHLGAESMDEIDAACQDAWNGLPSQRPLIEMTIPSSLDKTLSPPGQHVINLFVQYTPYELKNGTWKDSSIRNDFANRCFGLIDEYAPGFTSSIINYEMLAPPDLEEVFGLTGGNIFHGAMGIDGIFMLRPVKGWSGYQTPIKGLYMCGAGSHPGGGVTGAPGRNCARVVMQNISSLMAP